MGDITPQAGQPLARLTSLLLTETGPCPDPCLLWVLTRPPGARVLEVEGCEPAQRRGVELLAQVGLLVLRVCVWGGLGGQKVE